MAVKNRKLKTALIILACAVGIVALAVAGYFVIMDITDPLMCLEEGTYATSQTAQYSDESRGIHHALANFTITLTPVTKSVEMQQNKISCPRCKQYFEITFTATVDGENVKLAVTDCYAFTRNGYVLETQYGDEQLFFEVFLQGERHSFQGFKIGFPEGDVVLSKAS